MSFAFVATVACLAVIWVMALLQSGERSQAARTMNNITMTGISLVAAWSWEHCFDLALDVLGEKYEVGYGGIVPKLVLAVGVPFVLLPTYVTHIRKRVCEIEKKEEEEESEEEA